MKMSNANEKEAVVDESKNNNEIAVNEFDSLINEYASFVNYGSPIYNPNENHYFQQNRNVSPQFKKENPAKT